MDLKRDLIINYLNKYYDEPNMEKIIIIKKILVNKHKLSLRILDCFVTNYAKKKKIYLNEKYDIYQQYKLKLKSYSKMYFDPFSRSHKIKYYYNKTEYLETTPGQLCFFKWCFETNILEYVEKHYKIIEDDMKQLFRKVDTNDTKHTKLIEDTKPNKPVINRRNKDGKVVEFTVSF
jgi:hypothetical protein